LRSTPNILSQRVVTRHTQTPNNCCQGFIDVQTLFSASKARHLQVTSNEKINKSINLFVQKCNRRWRLDLTVQTPRKDATSANSCP